MRHKAIWPLVVSVLIGFAILVGVGVGIDDQGNAQAQTSKKGLSENDRRISVHAQRMMNEGRRIFRFDTFGSEAFWGDALQLHKAIAGEKNGGVGAGVSPKTALSVGLKVDTTAALQRYGMFSSTTTATSALG
jgi:hypothetical protein